MVEETKNINICLQKNVFCVYEVIECVLGQ